MLTHCEISDDNGLGVSVWKAMDCTSKHYSKSGFGWKAYLEHNSSSLNFTRLNPQLTKVYPIVSYKNNHRNLPEIVSGLDTDGYYISD